MHATFNLHTYVYIHAQTLCFIVFIIYVLIKMRMTVLHIILMEPYIQTNNEELYLYNNDVTYYVITCNSAFEYSNDVTYYVITRNYQWTPEGDPHK